jgi:hypothetical protein
MAINRLAFERTMRTGGSTTLLKTDSNDERPVLRCDNIVMAPRGIAETHGRKLALFVPTTDINRMRLKYGRSEHSPMVSMVLGGSLALVGIAGIILFFVKPSGFRYELGMAFFGVIGGSIVFDTLKVRYFLEVEGNKGISRLVFSKKAQKSEIDNFCNQVRTTYKYEITDEAERGV